MKRDNMYFILTAVFQLMFSFGLFAQEDLMNILEKNIPEKNDYTVATFFSTRILDGHSVELMPAGQLDLRISHRFGMLNQGLYNLFGIDQINNVRFGLEYGFLDRIMAGIGRSLYEKTYDAFGKFNILRQSTGSETKPLTLSAVASVAIRSQDYGTNVSFATRTAYVAQILAAKRFSQKLSLQISPSFVHHNLLATTVDSHNLFAIGAGGKLSLTKRISFNAEYYYRFNKKTYENQKTYDPLTLGFDIYTGGHVFQLMLTNSISTIEKAFIGETTERWRNGGIHLGFNISRVFTLKKPSGM
jgi:opacity protein-like surface antigen